MSDRAVCLQSDYVCYVENCSSYKQWNSKFIFTLLYLVKQTE